jgi:hypothetical protein
MLPANKSKRDQSRLEKLLGIAEALPEVDIRSEGQHRGFRVRGKGFAWYLYDHHGDGVVSLSAKSTRERQRELVASDPKRFFVPAYVGPAGWVGLRLDLPGIDWDDVADLLFTAFRLQAPRRLADQVG